MNKLTFFKLPLLFVLSYWLIGLTYSIAMVVIKTPEYMELGEYIIYSIVNTLFYGLPNYLLMFFLSALALNRCNVYTLTGKNVLLLIIIALVISVIVHLFYQFPGSSILGWLLSHDSYYYDQYLYIVVYQSIMRIICYFIIGLLTYFGILSLQSAFDSSREVTMLDKNNSPKIHLYLFLVLFMFLYMVFLVPLSSYVSYNTVDYYGARIISTIFYLVSVMIIMTIVFFLIKNMFSCAFPTLQCARIVKSTILSFLFSTIVNGIIGVGVFIIVMIIAFGSYYGDGSTIIFVILLGTTFQLVLTALIIRAVTKRYFSITFNESTL